MKISKKGYLVVLSPIKKIFYTERWTVELLELSIKFLPIFFFAPERKGDSRMNS